MSNDERPLHTRVSRLEFQMERFISDLESEKETRARVNANLDKQLADLRSDQQVMKQEIIKSNAKTDRIITIGMTVLAVIELASKFLR